MFYDVMHNVGGSKEPSFLLILAIRFIGILGKWWPFIRKSLFFSLKKRPFMRKLSKKMVSLLTS